LSRLFYWLGEFRGSPTAPNTPKSHFCAAQITTVPFFESVAILTEVQR
jgi:hypothetical protein